MIYILIALLTLVNICQFIYLKKQLNQKPAQPVETDSGRSMFSVLYGKP